MVRVVLRKTASKLKNKKTKTRHTKKIPGARESSRAPFVIVVCFGSGGGRVWTRRGGGSCVLTRQGGGSGGGRVEMVLVMVVVA